MHIDVCGHCGDECQKRIETATQTVWEAAIQIVRTYERERYGRMRSLSFRETIERLEAAKQSKIIPGNIPNAKEGR